MSSRVLDASVDSAGGGADAEPALAPGVANQQVFSDELLKAAEEDRSILVVTSDSRGSGKLIDFGKRLPKQIVEMGIAEQNLVGVAAGLASTGKKAFAVSPACFLTARSLEQIKNDVAYSNQPVRLVGISAGVSYGALGTTHHSLHDFAVLQAINNIEIIAPADNFETAGALRVMLATDRPFYIRLGKKNMPHLHSGDDRFEFGKARVLRMGSDVTFIATGEPVLPALQAADALAARRVSAGVLSMHTLRPFDEAAVLQAARTSRAIITVEEHSVHGGLGSRVASLLMQAGMFVTMQIVGIPDEYTYTGSQGEIFAHYGITASGLAERAVAILGS